MQAAIAGYKRLFVAASLTIFLTSCASHQVVEENTVEESSPGVQTAVAEPPPVCVPKEDPEQVQKAEALRKLALGQSWHAERRYDVAMRAYESSLAENASPLSDVYALWGMLNLLVDRDNPDYSRDRAQQAYYVIESRVARLKQINDAESSAEADMIMRSAQKLLDADQSKDIVVNQNKRLAAELAKKEEALEKLKALTLGN